MLDSWEAQHPAPDPDVRDEPGPARGLRHESMSVFEAVGKMPYDFSPARLRCRKLSVNMGIPESADR
jgi:hypothetical protein